MTDATKGMVGGGFYDAHSTFQAEVAASGAALLNQAVESLELPADGKIIVADYGCGEGRNSMATIGTALRFSRAAVRQDRRFFTMTFQPMTGQALPPIWRARGAI